MVLLERQSWAQRLTVEFQNAPVYKTFPSIITSGSERNSGGERQQQEFYGGAREETGSRGSQVPEKPRAKFAVERDFNANRSTWGSLWRGNGSMGHSFSLRKGAGSASF